MYNFSWLVNNSHEVRLMFTRQKKNYRVFVYAALIIALCVLLAAFLWPKDAAEPAGSQELSAKEGEDKNIVYRDEGLESEASDENDANEGINDDENEDDENVQASDNGQEAYYLVKRNGDGVSVFFCTPEGERSSWKKRISSMSCSRPQIKSNLTRD